MTQDAEATQKQRVLDALEIARIELRDYRLQTQQRADFLYKPQAEDIRADMLGSVQVFADRFTLIKALIHGGAGAEVGVRHGVLSRFLLDSVAPESLDLFEKNENLISRDVLGDPRVNLHLGDSSTRLNQCEDRSFDWIYIDGAHHYHGIKKDTEAACRKIKNGGILIFDDYTIWSPVEGKPYGVVAVVNKLINEGHPVIGLAIPSHGYHNIALRYLPA